MKKVLSVFLVLVILAVAALAFLRGWVNYAVPQGAYGVLRSKSHGVELVEPGVFAWRWTRLIPGNTELVVFMPLRQSGVWMAQGELPQAEALRGFTGLPGAYIWKAAGDFSFRLDPALIPALFESGALSGQADLDEWDNRTRDAIAAFAARQCALVVDGAAGGAVVSTGSTTGELSTQSLQTQLLAALRSEFPEAQDLAVTARWEAEPDLGLYAVSRQVYGEYLAAQRDSLVERASALAAKKQNDDAEIERLKRYGELLTQYPVLSSSIELLQNLEQE